MDWHVFRTVENVDGSAKFLINCTLKSGILKMIIMQNSVARSTEIDQDVIDASSNKLEMNSSDYLRTLKEYLNSNNSEFKFHKNEFVLQHNLSAKYKVKYLQCKLVKIENIFECAGALLQTMYEERNNAINEMSTLKEETNHLRKSTSILESKLNEFILRKKKDEEVLYSNFVLVLNEKKTRIQHLTELLEAFRHGRPTVNSPPKITEKIRNTKTVKVEVKNEVSESETEESEVEYNTDDEKSTTCERLEENLDQTKANNDFSYIEESKAGTSKENLPGTSRDCVVSSLLEDSPPHYSLPKRTKYNDRANDEVDIPSHIAGSSKDCIEETRVESDDNSSFDDSLNTQDLLNDL